MLTEKLDEEPRAEEIILFTSFEVRCAMNLRKAMAALLLGYVASSTEARSQPTR